MDNRVVKLYKLGRLSVKAMLKAVDNGLLTKAEFEEAVGDTVVRKRRELNESED